ncbi:CDP-diacylglycerol--serine O-phosphatidyltransferase [Adhaeribacter radiodurans]|uniref:CDP-diacylglycerol--serine O-phosphatidyltransferase n=1 Tax=Adhaeribacter radiodurans TaxID=2745197 RepID=A0A7L7LBI0_9BACT|nr:CDP-diacylglycerol--serine O-phosphatidyltransferase [Adhaeribacter radiodurans]QMU30191.1 CDP-diacylglycerol--serine O-phosphatidyltransferase [Adhaeribacter radiodurans]
MKKLIPNTITCLNLFTGCVAIFAAFQDSLAFAAYLVYLAAIFDFLDGMIARLLHAYSEIGKQLDSLADMVSFGVLPGVIMFKLMQKAIRSSESASLLTMELFPFFAFLIIIFSALRLAKFNIDSRQTTSFIGVPTPANTLLISSLPLILDNDLFNLHYFILNPVTLSVLTLIMSYLMVAEIPLFALKFKNFTWKDNSIRFIFLIIALPLLFLLKFAAIPVIIVLYILLSLIKPSYS